jgi:hypothetical protein
VTRWGRPPSSQWRSLCRIVEQTEHGYVTACRGRWKVEDGLEAFDEAPYGRALCGACVREAP